MGSPASRIEKAATISLAEVSTSHGVYEVIKPLLDGVLSMALPVISLPLVVIAIVLVKLSSEGPVIYEQERVGLAGAIFTIYKIRTMYLGSEQHCGPKWAVPGDSRITPVGRILRLSHLDELPQLVNILRGEMSLVGPRPECPEFVDELDRVLPGYRRRLAVRPGLTGLAQVKQPPDVDLFSVRRKLTYDLFYVDRYDSWLDLRVLAGTALKCLGVPFVWIGSLLQLPDPSHRGGHEPVLPEPDLALGLVASNSSYAGSQWMTAGRERHCMTALTLASDGRSFETSQAIPERQRFQSDTDLKG